MATVFLIGVEESLATAITRALAIERHRVEHKSRTIMGRDLIDADIVFAGGCPSDYLPLLRLIRVERPGLPFIVVSDVPETSAWLDALEAGATDYCASPFESRQIHWLMESALPKHFAATVPSFKRN